MKTAVFSGILLAGLLAACAPGPAYSGPARAGTAKSAPIAGSASDLRAAFAPEGVAWVSGGQGCVARLPDFVPRCPRIGYAVDTAWQGAQAWAAVPGLGQVVTLDQAPQSVNAGAVTALSSRHIYRQDGSALTYAGQPDGGVVGRPAQVITGGDGLDYALLAGQLIRVVDGAVIDAAPQPYLLATATGVTSSAVPAAQIPGSSLPGALGEYRLQAGQLQRLDAAGQVVARVNLEAAAAAGRVGLVGNQVVVVGAGGQLWRFNTALEPL